MNQIRVGIISFEHMHAYSYANAFRNRAGVPLVAAAESDAERMKRVQADFPFIPKVYTDYRAMLDSEQIDAVIITSANIDHASIAIECAKRGKHVMCEKPLATTVEDGVAMIRAAKESKVKLMTAFPVRFSPAINEAREAIWNGSLGKLIGGCTSNHGSMPGGWFIEKAKSGGGAVMDHTVHVADILRWMLKDEVEEIYAEYATRLHDINIDDVGLLLMKFRNGAVVSLDTSWSRPKSYSTWGDVKLDIRGEKANVSVNCFPRSINHYDDTTMRHSGFPAGEDLDALMVDEFLACIRENREPMVTGEDGLRAMEIALAAYDAGASGKVIKIRHAQI